MTTEHPSRNLSPAASAAAAHALVDAELSTGARVGHGALLLSAVAMTIVIGSLWMTEPSLPVRTKVAFGVMVLIGLSWAVYAGWVLTTRRVLLGRHRVIAGRMAVTFATTFVVGSLLTTAITGHRAGYAAAALGAGMLAVAVWLLVRARRQVIRLAARRAEIQRSMNAR